ncbi:MAG: sugar phosphate isomerase/epimerase family protein [Gemmataceae bacterium]
MFVACSTLCFGKHSLDNALHIISELRFAKVDLAIHEDGHHLKPSEVAADVHHAALALKTACPLGLAAYHVRIHATDHADRARQLKAVCRLARLTAVPVICIPAPPAAEDPSRATAQLSELVKLADAEGVILTVETHMGTLAETPEGAIELCRRAPGLSLTLDPSHFLVGAARGQSFDAVFPYVKHVRLRDTGAGPHEFQVRVGQGQVDYGRIINLLERQRYDRLLTVDIRDIPDAPFAMEPEVRKLKYLLESLV